MTTGKNTALQAPPRTTQLMTPASPPLCSASTPLVVPLLPCKAAGSQTPCTRSLTAPPLHSSGTAPWTHQGLQTRPTTCLAPASTAAPLLQTLPISVPARPKLALGPPLAAALLPRAYPHRPPRTQVCAWSFGLGSLGISAYFFYFVKARGLWLAYYM